MKISEKQETLTFATSWVDKTLPYISISEVLGLLNEPFDKMGVAQKTFDKNFDNPDSQYYQKTVDQIIEAWEAKGAESCKYGRLLDEYIGVVLEGSESDKELYKLDNDIDGDERLAGLIQSFDEFLAYMTSNYPALEYVTREKMLYYKLGDFYVRGRFDALFYDTSRNKWIIIDWKSSGTIDKTPTKWTKNLLGAAKAYPALNWYTYTMQLYFYKTALLNHYLPEGTTSQDVEVWIVNLPGKELEDSKYFAIHPAAFIYDQSIMDKIFSFGFKKQQLLSK